MTVNEIRDRAQILGLTLPARMRKGEMIRSIQREEGNQDCFGAVWRASCPWSDCCWRSDCNVTTPG